LIVCFWSVLGGNSESDSVVVSIEVGVVLSHEDVSEDQVVEGGREDWAHDSVDALGDTVWLDGDDVVLIGEHVVDVVNGEGDVWEGLDVLAESVDGDAVDEFVDESLGSNDDWSSWIDDSVVSGHVNDVLAGLLHGGELQWPVFLLSNVVELHLSVECFLFIAWDGDVTEIWVVVEIEGETLVGEVAGINESGEVIDGDGSVSES
jgi:hypothetical protein